MGQSIRAQEQLAFGGVHYSQNPARRPPSTASYCNNLRVMPDPTKPWLRQWGGRKARLYGADGQWLQFHEYNDPAYAGWTNQMGRHLTAGNVARWRWFALSNYTIIEIMDINGSHDSNFSRTNRTAIENLRNGVVLYNGLGEIDASGSRPPFTHYDPAVNQKRYFGLHPHVPSGVNPTVGTTAGTINVVNRRHIWVGLYNSISGHYSNAVYCGVINPANNITIRVSNLDRIKYSFHAGSNEEGSLRWVFYATADGGSSDHLQNIAYLLNDPVSPYGPLGTFVTNTSYDITTLAGLNVTAEMPTLNYPPRPMRWLAYVGERMYGGPMLGGDGNPVSDFNYSPLSRELTRIHYSLAASDVQDAQFVGNPEECWPLDAYTQTPTTEITIWGQRAPDGYRLVTWTPTGCFLVEEEADGKHVWTACKSGPDLGSNVHGLRNPDTVRQSRHGVLWITQRNQVALLRGENVTILSDAYQPLFRGKTVRFATYTYDPINSIDRYEIYLSDSTAIIHDFASNAAYTISGVDYTAGATLTDFNAVQHHLLAKASIYTQAGQPEDGLEKVRVETATGVGTSTFAAIDGEWRSQWLDEGDPGLEKHLSHVDITGDVDRIAVEYYRNMQEMSAATKLQTAKGPIIAEGVDGENRRSRHKTTGKQKYNRLRVVIKLTGLNDAAYDTHPAVDQLGEQDRQRRLLGCVCAMDRLISGIGESRS